MSRIGKKPVMILDGVQVSIAETTATVKGPKGELQFTIPVGITVEVQDKEIKVTRADDEPATRSAHGLTRNVLSNMIVGVKDGFHKKLEIIGVGYKAQATGKKVTLSLGYSHPIEFDAPEGISIINDPELKNVIVVEGHDKQLVGEVSANIRKFRKPEPYKGKGIRYLGEYVPRKAGKSAAK